MLLMLLSFLNTNLLDYNLFMVKSTNSCKTVRFFLLRWVLLRVIFFFLQYLTKNWKASCTRISICLSLLNRSKAVMGLLLIIPREERNPWWILSKLEEKKKMSPLHFQELRRDIIKKSYENLDICPNHR